MKRTREQRLAATKQQAKEEVHHEYIFNPKRIKKLLKDQKKDEKKD